MRPARALLVASMILVTGCYTYTPTRLDTIRPGQDVRVRLSGEATDRLEAVRFTDDRLMTGTLVEESPAELIFETAVRQTATPMQGARALTQRLDLSPADILEVETRSLSNSRTGALVAAIGAGVGAIVIAAIQGGGGNQNGGDPGPVEDRRFPFGLKFRLPF